MGRQPGLTHGTRLPSGVAAAFHRVAAALHLDASSVSGGEAWSRLDVADDRAVLREIVAVGEARLDDHAGPRAAGAVYTPYDVAADLVALVDIRRGEVICDPAVGGGVFLVATAERLRDLGADLDEVEASLSGFDVDPTSVLVARSVLDLWGWWRYGERRSFEGVCEADALLGLGGQAPPVVDVVVGNPPFLGQLKSDTSRTVSRAVALRQRFGPLVTPYVDDSALFLVAAAELVGPAGRMCLIVPASTLGASSSEPIRRRLETDLGLRGLWVGGAGVFAGASVDVVAPVLGGPRGDHDTIWLVERGSNRAKRDVASVGEHWQRVLGVVSGVPWVEGVGGETVGDRAVVTADFRDAYYWLADRVVESESEGDGGARLATVGLVDPLYFRHGTTDVRFAKRRFRYPVVGVEAATDPGFDRWRRRRSVPKLLVATQTKVIECVVDPTGALLPSTPLLTVEPASTDDLWLLAAAFTSPFLSAWAASLAGGTGLGSGTFRLRAAQLAEAPLPVEGALWERAAELARRIHVDGAPAGPPRGELRRLGSLMNAAYGRPDDDGLLDWWTARLVDRGS